MEEYKEHSCGYEISNLGNVRRMKNDGNYKYLKCSVMNRGYRYFQIHRKGTRKNYLIHHLVAELFIGERPDGLVIDHIDRDKLNNKLENLRYITIKENIRNSHTFLDDKKTAELEEEGYTRIQARSRTYHIEHREELLKKKKDYYYKNKERLLQYQKERNDKERYKVKCECGSELFKKNMRYHLKTKKHRDYIDSIIKK